MAKKDLIVHLCSGKTEVVDKDNVVFHNQADLEIDPASDPDPVDDAITDKKDVFMRECVCKLEPGPDAYAIKEKVLAFEYWRLDEDGNRTGDRPIRFRLHIKWSDIDVNLDHVIAYLTGGATNHDPNASLGGTLSSFEVQPGLVDTVDGLGLYDDITYDEHKPAAEGGTGDTEYRVIRVINSSPAGAVDMDFWIEDPDDPDPAAALDSYGYEIRIAKDADPFVSLAANENTDPGPEGAYNLETRSSPLSVVAVDTTGVNLVFKRIVTVDP